MVCDGVVRQVRLQWSFSNFAMIPPGIEADPAETLAGYDERQKIKRANELARAELFVMTEKIDISEILDDLCAQGYHLVSIAWQSRIDTRGSRYPAVYAVFVHGHFREPQPDMAGQVALLQPLTKDVLWRARGYSNPLLNRPESELVQCSLNFEARTPLFDNHGHRICARVRDTLGNKTDERIPIQPAAQLRLLDGIFQLCR